MKRILFSLFSIISAFLSQAQTPYFTGLNGRPANEAELQSCLSRAMTGESLYKMTWTHYNWDTYDPAALTQDINMFASLNARFIGRVAGLWESEDWVNAGYFNMLPGLVSQINAAYAAQNQPAPVLQAAIFEIATSAIGPQIPQYVYDAFATDLNLNVADYKNEASVFRNFQVSRMHYNTALFGPGTNRSDVQVMFENNPTKWVPDISQPETQMWYYYLATRYIDSGFRGLHFGNVNIIDENDPSHTALWRVLKKVRDYATLHSTFVLCDAHVGPNFYPYVSQSPKSLDPQLLFDFHASPLRIQTDASKPWPNYQNGGGALLKKAVDGGTCDPLYGQSPAGGLTPLGWTTTYLPYLVEFDNYLSSNTTIGNPGPSSCNAWGWDEITWYALQSEYYRNQWLKYAYYNVKCMDPKANLQIQGVRGISGPVSIFYRASNGSTAFDPAHPKTYRHYNQQDMIKRLWDGEYNKDWVHYSTGLNNAHIRGNPAFIGNTVYYIGSDGRVYAATSAGSPSQWTQLSVFTMSGGSSSQVKAAGDLVAAANGQYLYYRGTDNEIYGYSIVGTAPATSTYTYFKLTPNATLQTGEKVQSDLMCFGNNLYYRSDSNRLYGYIKQGSVWSPISPTWTANAPLPTKVQTLATAQALVAGSIVMNATGNKLYYRGTDNLVHGFYVTDGASSYEYFDLPFSVSNGNLASAEQVAGQLVCTQALMPNSDRLFYIGQDGRVFGFLQNAPYGIASTQSYGGVWGKISPSWSAQLTPAGLHEQRLAATLLAASPDGKTLMYRGSSYGLHGFRILDDYNSEYFDIDQIGSPDFPGAFLCFKSNSEVFYRSYYTAGSSNYSLHIMRLESQSLACANQAIKIIEKTYDYSRGLITTDLSLAASTETVAATLGMRAGSERINVLDLTASPNPANTSLYLELSSEQVKTASAELSDIYGRSVLKTELMRKGANAFTAELSVQPLVEGVYLLTVTDNTGNTRTSKVLIKH